MTVPRTRVAGLRGGIYFAHFEVVKSGQVGRLKGGEGTHTKNDFLRFP